MAKLVEILARELKVWPDAWMAVGQACDGTLHGEPFTGRHTSEKYTICDRFIVDEVTRAEWQAAVDALKAKEAVEWDGVGLPPVGTRCEMSIGDSGNEWVEGVVVCHINWDRPVAVAHNEEDVFNGYAEDFRPIRTPEQIAAEDRRNGIAGIAEDAGNRPWGVTIQEWLYDLGYRKQEPK